MAKGKQPTTSTAGMTASAQNNDRPPETVSGYFRKLFEENPQWLDARGNQDLLDRWLKDHPAETAVPERVKQNLSNIKSVLRKKLREQPARQMKQIPPHEAPPSPVEAPRLSLRKLESLEERIDGCLDLARSMDREGLESVIGLLRRARNEVVWRMGEP